MFVLNDKIEIVDIEWDPAPINSMIFYTEETNYEYETENQLVLVSSE